MASDRDDTAKEIMSRVIDKLTEKMRDKLMPKVLPALEASAHDHIGTYLSRWASEGFIECAWDEENNRMLFWQTNHSSDD
jgi:hypothetical protein